jgi:hypothetical protein
MPTLVRRTLTTALPLALLLAGLATHRAWARSGPGGLAPVHGRGRLLLALADGTLREPSTDRAEFTESPDVLDSNVTSWDLSLAEGSVDRAGALRARSVDWAPIEIRRGLGHGLELAAQAQPWNGARVEQGIARIPVDRSGIGPTTLGVRERVFGGAEDRPALTARAWVRIPGSNDGPDTHGVEGGVSLPFAAPLSDATRLGGMAETALVADAASNGQHAEESASLELTHDVLESLDTRLEAVSVWSGERGRPWLGVLDGGLSWDATGYLGLTVGVSAGVGGGVSDVGGFARVSVHH